jgi:hypothetical protein
MVPVIYKSLFKHNGAIKENRSFATSLSMAGYLVTAMELSIQDLNCLQMASHYKSYILGVQMFEPNFVNVAL